MGTALFVNVPGLTADSAGDWFATDEFILPPEPNTIAGSMVARRITASGPVTTFAGALGMQGSADVHDNWQVISDLSAFSDVESDCMHQTDFDRFMNIFCNTVEAVFNFF